MSRGVEMTSASFLLPINRDLLLRSSSTTIKWRFRSDKSSSPVDRITRSQAFRVLANPNVSGEGNSKNEVIMVDPLEAKRLAAKQMQQIRAREKFKVN